MAPQESNAEGRQLASGFLHLMMSQLASRILTFALNLFIARRLTPDEFGLAALQFQLLTSSILFISREGFRRGCVRGDLGPQGDKGREISGTPSQNAGVERMMRVAWLCVPVGVAITLASCGAVVYWQGLPLTDAYAQAILLLGLSALLELGSEPLYILAQSLVLLRLRAGMEALASLVRCLLTLALVLAGVGREGGVLFGLAEVGYGGTLLVGYWLYFLRFHSPSPSTTPRPQPDPPAHQEQQAAASATGAPKEDEPLLGKEGPRGPRAQGAEALPLFPFTARGLGKRKGGPGAGVAGGVDGAMLRLCLAFSLQALVKLVLGKGDEFVLVLLESRFNQGVYGLVSKLGSLVVRCILQPFEESAFILFAKTAPPISAQQQKLSPEEAKRRKTTAGGVLLLSLKLVSLLGLVFVAFGPSYSRLLLQILYGPTWAATEAPTALACYCVYIMALALNGTTEAFVHAVMTERQLAGSNVWLTLFSLLHMGLSVVLVRAASAPGLILSNCCNMAMRIAFCLVFISSYFKDVPAFSLAQSMPSQGVCLALLASAVVTHLSNALAFSTPPLAQTGSPNSVSMLLLTLVPYSLHIVVGVTCLGGVLLSLYIFERQFLRSISTLLARRGESEHAKED